MTNHYRKGRRREYATQRILEKAGYTASRTAGSHGPIDIYAFDRNGFRLIQCKAGGGRVSAIEREKLGGLVRPANASIEIWRWPDGAREPLIEVVT